MTPAWVNWEQVTSLNEEETKRAEKDRAEAREAEQEKFYRMTGQIQNEAQGQAGARQFGGLEKIGKFKDVMDARDAALKNQTPMMGAAWEQYLDPGKNAPYKSPWADLDKRLGGITAGAEREQKAAVQRETDRQERDRKEVEKQRADAIAKEADRKAGIKEVEDKIRYDNNLEELKEVWDSVENAYGNDGRETKAKNLVLKYGLSHNDPRVREFLKSKHVNLDWFDGQMYNYYGGDKKVPTPGYTPT
jgi:hypothetical protein